jgi:hypothetical protein
MQSMITKIEPSYSTPTHLATKTDLFPQGTTAVTEVVNPLIVNAFALYVNIESPGTAVAAVTDAIVKVIEMPFGKRPFRTYIDPAQNGCEVVNAVANRIRAEFLRRIDLDDLLVHPVNN